MSIGSIGKKILFISQTWRIYKWIRFIGECEKSCYKGGSFYSPRSGLWLVNKICWLAFSWMLVSCFWLRIYQILPYPLMFSCPFVFFCTLNFSRFLLAEAAGACATFNLFFVVKRYRFWLRHSFPTCPTAKAVMSFRVLKKLDSIRRTDSKSSNNNVVIRNVNINY